MAINDRISHHQIHTAVQAYATTEERCRFESLTQPNAKAWLYASTKFEDLIVEDIIAADGIHRIIGLAPDLPTTCKICNKSTLPDPQDHGIRCSVTKGGPGSAGGILERAVIQGLKSLDCEVRTKPDLRTIAGFPATSEASAKRYGDALVFAGGRSTVVDVTFASKARYSLEKKERDKIAEYVKHRDPAMVKAMFVPLAMDLVGGQGPTMIEYLEAILEHKQRANPAMKKEFAMKFRFVQERLSVAAIRAIGAYMRYMRYGYVKSRHQHGGNDDTENKENENEENIIDTENEAPQPHDGTSNIAPDLSLLTAPPTGLSYDSTIS